MNVYLVIIVYIARRLYLVYSKLERVFIYQ